MSDRGETLRYWLQDHWKVMLLLGAVIAVIVAVYWSATSRSKSPVVYEDARIVRFGVHHFRDGSRPLILVRVKSGRVIQLNT